MVALTSGSDRSDLLVLSPLLSEIICTFVTVSTISSRIKMDVRHTQFTETNELHLDNFLYLYRYM